MGELVHAAVTMRDGGRATASDLMKHCRGGLSAYKVPVTVHILDALPLTGSGKVQKSKVRDEIIARIRGIDGGSPSTAERRAESDCGSWCALATEATLDAAFGAAFSMRVEIDVIVDVSISGLHITALRVANRGPYDGVIIAQVVSSETFDLLSKLLRSSGTVVVLPAAKAAQTVIAAAARGATTTSTMAATCTGVTAAAGAGTLLDVGTLEVGMETASGAT
jgi:hypothetical protein